MPTGASNADTPVVPLSEPKQNMAKINPTIPEQNMKAEAISSETVPGLSAVPMSVAKNMITDNEVRHWIQSHIKMRVCKWFVPRPKPADPSDPICHCNYAKSKHTASAIANYNKNKEENKWKADEAHTESLPTHSFGDIEFIGYGKKMSKYVRLEPTTSMNLVLELMLEQWQLDPPKLLISVTGGAKNFHMQPRLSEVFRRGLMTAASSTGAWIITGGMYAGVMKLVGQAVDDWIVAHGSKTKVTAIGIAPWGCVNNKESLLETKGGQAQYRLEKPRLLKHAPIDMNHSHFIFVDNGTQQIYATEIAFRAELEKAVNTMGTDAAGEKIEVPVVCVVVEGGPGTLETVMRALQSGTPAVIIEGSRRAADILAYAYWNSHEIEVNATDHYGKKVKKMVPVFDDDLWKKVKQMIFDEFGDRDIDSRLNWVKECFQYRHNMTIFRLDGVEGTKSIDVAILQALLKANKERVTDQLKLALAWNRIDVAESDIFTEDKRWEKGELDDAMFMALVKNRPDFIELLLGNGLSLKDFLTIRNMLRLYNDIPENSMLYSMLPQRRRDGLVSLEDIGRAVRELIGDSYQPLYLRDARYKDLDVGSILRGQASRAISTVSINNHEEVHSLYEKACIGNDNAVIKGVTKIVCYDAKTGEQFVVHDFDEPARELFIWAVLLNRFELAHVFWKEGKGSIAAALTAEKIIKSMLSRTEDTEAVKLLGTELENFKELSLGVLSECHAADEKKAGMLLVRQVDSFGKATAMQLAVSADNKEFISHAACQSLLNSIWRGRIPQDLSLWRLGVCILLPPLVYALIQFRSDDREQLMRDNNKEKEKRSKAKSLKLKDLEMLEMQNGAARSSIVTTNSRTPLFEDSSDLRSENDRSLSCVQKMVSFFNAPFVTFIYNCLSYVAFLLLYSYMLLTDFQEALSITEIIIIIWVFTLWTEEIRQVIMDDSFSLRLKFLNYFSDPWNIVDVLCILSYITGLILRFIPLSACSQCFSVARIVLALNLMTFYFRILNMFSVHKELGPKIVMIGRMMIDLMHFVVILLVFIIAFGIASQAIMYPNTPLSWDLIINILRKPYWQMYGELFLEELEAEIDCSDNATVLASGALPRCPVKSQVVPILLGVYILITNVLMLNLLIAMFSYTFESVQTNADAVWKIQRYDLVKEYYERPPFTPPFILIAHIFLISRKIGTSCGCCTWSENNPFKILLTEEEDKQLILWENLNQDDYVRNSQIQKKAELNNQVCATHEMVSSILNKVEEVAESNFMISGSHTSSSTSSNQPKLPPALDERLTYLEEQMKRTSFALDWIIKSLSENKLGSKDGPPKLPDIDQMKKEAANKKKAIEEKEKEQVQEMLKRQLELHVKSRTKRYACPKDIIYRFPVPDDKVMWNVAWPDYDPVTYTDKIVLDNPKWADEDLLAYDVQNRPLLRYNDMDVANNVDRRSFIGKYDVKGGLPINPKGRTGLNGRGMLGRWGPNLAGDPVVTRWAKNQRGEFIKQDGQKVLEFVSVQRQDTKQWAIPGGLLELGQTVDKALKADFTEEALDNLPDPQNRDQENVKLNKLFQKGVEVYKGYSDDPRNTDNAWVETTAVNFHDESGLLTNMTLRAGGSAEMVRWMRISTAESLYAAHIAILQKVAQQHDAAF